VQDQRVGSWSLAGAGAAVLIAQDYHPIMLAALRTGQTGAWISMLAAGLLAAAILWPVMIGLRRIPGGSLIDLARAAAGTPGAIIMSILVGAILVFHGGFVLRQTAEMAVSAVYPHTPQTFAVVALTLCTLYGAWGGTASLIRLCRLFLPPLLISIVLVLVGTYPWGELHYLQPLWGPGTLPLLWQSILLTAIYGPVLFFLMGAGLVHDRKGLVPAGLAAVAGTAVIFAATKIVLVMTFPYPMGRGITFPMHEMSRLVLGGRFFERIEGLWVYVWVFGTACHLAALIHTAALAYAKSFGMHSHRTAVFPLVMMTIVVAFFPPDQHQAIVWHSMGAPVGLAVAFVLPLVLVGVAALRGRLGQRAL
jgi:spore germination protein KB